MAIERAGAPQGNLNSAKSVLPALRRLRRGKPLPPELTRIAALADREAEELISDRGGWEGMSGAEQLMVANWKAARQAELLIWQELIDKGAVHVNEGLPICPLSTTLMGTEEALGPSASRQVRGTAVSAPGAVR